MDSGAFWLLAETMQLELVLCPSGLATGSLVPREQLDRAPLTWVLASIPAGHGIKKRVVSEAGLMRP